MFRILPLLILLIHQSYSHAQTQLPAFFSDNMVLQQQQQEVSIRGKDHSKTDITLVANWGNTATTTTNSKGIWKNTLQTPNAGGSYTISVQGSEKSTLHNILIGEVWPYAGQSNMDMPLTGFTAQPLQESLETILNSKNNNIGLFHTKTKRKTPILFYNGMLYAYIGNSIKGFLWYQGESNRKYPIYAKLFPAMIAQVRSQWQEEVLPFYFVQIAPYDKNSGSKAAVFREAQLQTLQNTAHIGMIVTLDIGDCGVIYPKNKKTVGNRRAYWALSKNYGYDAIVPSGPIYQTMEQLDNRKIKLFFEYTAKGLSSFNTPLRDFEVAGQDQIFYPTAAIINKDKTITVWSDKVMIPLAARYAFKNCVSGTLFNTLGLPASSFRTDSWNKQYLKKMKRAWQNFYHPRKMMVSEHL